ncbi:MAG: phenylalanine--tRNA ligase subunit beta [Burkholderiaceae bacterium]
MDDQVTGVPDPAPIRLRFDRTRKVIGAPLDDAQILAALARLQLVTHPLDAQSVEVAVPSHRFDLRIEEDLIEEVARLHGYDRLPVRPPMAPAVMRGGEEGRRRLIDIKRLVAAQDFQEVINYSFVDGQTDQMLTGIPAIRLLNPIAQTMDVMRTTLWGGMLGTLRSNLNRRASRIRLFESGRAFLADASRESGPLQIKGIDQPMRLAMLAAGPAAPEQWGTPTRAVDFFDLKAHLAVLLGSRPVRYEAALHPALHPGRSARMLLGGQMLGWIGELHPAHQRSLDLPGPVMLAEVDLAPLLQSDIPVFMPVSRFPPSIRDIALVVDQSIPAARIDGHLRSIAASNPAAKCVRNIRLFDEYRGKGLENKEKSLAFRIWMQDTERTLEEAEVNAAVDSLVSGLARQFNARLR